MTLKEHLKKNVKLATPVVVGQLGHIMVSVADTAMVGQVGVIPLAAATFAGTIYHLFLLFGIGSSYAMTPLVAATDKNDKKTLLGYLQNGFALNLSIGIVLAIIGYMMIPFLHLFGQEEPVWMAAGPYLGIVCASMTPVMLFQTFRQFAEGQSDTFRPMIVSVFANLLNVGLNYLLIFGNFGAPALGLNGAGYATFISRVIMVIAMMAITYKSWKHFRFEFDFGIVKRMFKLGVPSGMQYVFEIGAFSMAAIMVGWMGAEQLAAHQIALNMAAVTYMAASGVGAAASIRIGNQMGLKDLPNLKMAGYSCFGLVAVFMAFCGLMLILFRFPLTRLYIDEPEVQNLAAALLIIAAGFQISDGLQAVGLGVLRGLTDVKVPTIVTFIAYWMTAIPGSYLLGFVFDLGVHGVWYALSGGLTIAAILHIVRFRSLTNKLNFG